MGKMQPHWKYIVYSRDLLLHHSTCGTARLVDTIAKREYDRMDMRVSAKLISCWLCRDTQWAASGGRCVGDLEDESSGAQQLPDSLVADSRAAASLDATCSGQQKVERECFPTEAKERQKQRRKQQKETEGQVVPKRRQKKVEDHFDDCGDDLSSLDVHIDMSKTSCAQFVGYEWSDVVVGDVTQWDLLTYTTLDNMQWHLLVGAQTTEECSAQKRRA